VRVTEAPINELFFAAGHASKGGYPDAATTNRSFDDYFWDRTNRHHLFGGK
jgi:hypothetical protein